MGKALRAMLEVLMPKVPVDTCITNLMHHKQGLPGKRAYGGKAKLRQVPEWQQDFDQFKDDQLTKLVDLPSGEKHRIINEAWSASTNARRTARRQLDAAKARLRSLNRGVLTEGEEGTP